MFPTSCSRRAPPKMSQVPPRQERTFPRNPNTTPGVQQMLRENVRARADSAGGHEHSLLEEAAQGGLAGATVPIRTYGT